MTRSVVIRPTDDYDAAELAATMRQSDRDEIDAGTGGDPLSVLLGGIQMSAETWTAVYQGRVMAIWGVVPAATTFLGPRIGVGWLLTSNEVDRHPKAFWRACRKEIKELLERWHVLTNVIDTRHEKALRWAERLGFHLEGPQPMGRLGVPFRRFAITKENLHV